MKIVAELWTPLFSSFQAILHIHTKCTFCNAKYNILFSRHPFITAVLHYRQEIANPWFVVAQLIPQWFWILTWYTVYHALSTSTCLIEYLKNGEEYSNSIKLNKNWSTFKAGGLSIHSKSWREIRYPLKSLLCRPPYPFPTQVTFDNLHSLTCEYIYVIWVLS